MTIGERIKSTRLDHDEMQKELAYILQCTPKQIGRYENDDQEMTVSKIIAFCKHYRVSADYLLGLPKDLNWPR